MIILHHYEMSPFSEKIRLMFGYTGSTWQSLVSPEMPPRPNLDPLTGGYRRIPVAQIGADLICDTRLISEELADLTGKPELSPRRADPDVQSYLAQLESNVFWASVLSIPAGVTLRQLLRNIGIWSTLRFIKDRASVGKNARTDMPSPRRASEQFQQHLEEMEQRLVSNFLFGDAPTVADFCAYHTLWFKREVGELPLPPGLPRVADWYQRIRNFGHGQRREISGAQASATARDNAPRTVPDQYGKDPRIGSSVSAGPSDYALETVSGTLVGVSGSRYIIARESATAGTVHVHFPRSGFELTVQ